MRGNIVTWNIKEGNSDSNVDNGMRFFKKHHNPFLVGLQEAKNYGRAVDGYVRIQHDSESYGAAPETANIALYVRDDVYDKVEGVYSKRMKKRWKGPKLGIVHDPRVYRGVKIDGVVYWCVHVPVGGAEEARAETFAWMRRVIWTPGRVVIFGDLNAKPYTLKKALRLAWRKIWYRMRNVDGFLLKKVISESELTACPSYDSDHRPLVLNVKGNA